MRLPSGQALAYLGDAVYEVTLREIALEKGIDIPEKLHQFVASFTHAEAQSIALESIDPQLTEEEKAYFKLGRNATVSKKSRNVSIEIAHRSTGFEAIFGALYLNKESQRIKDLCSLIVSAYFQ